MTTQVVEEARRRHDLFPTAAAALGRLLTAAAMLASALKDDERILLQVMGDGPLGPVVAESDAHLRVRGYVGDPAVHLPLNGEHKLDVAAAVGKGHLYVVRDMGLKEPYRAAVPLVSGEIARDIAYYLAVSEQTPAAVALGVLVSPDGSIASAGGWMVTPMPGADPSLVADIERRSERAEPVSRAASRLEKGSSPAQLLVQAVLEDMQPQVLSESAVVFACPCSRSRFEAGLVALGRQELTSLSTEQDSVELRCRFCGRRYLFSARRMRELAERSTQRTTGPSARG